MKISVSKLIANRSNALKSTGPRSEVGKRRSAANAKRYGLNSLLILDELELGAELSSLVADAIQLGYSEQDARAVVATLGSDRSKAPHLSRQARIRKDRSAHSA